MSDARQLLSQKRQLRKVNDLFAEYQGQRLGEGWEYDNVNFLHSLRCSLCNIVVKNDALWPAHVKSTSHLANLEKEMDKRMELEEEDNKRRIESDSESDREHKRQKLEQDIVEEEYEESESEEQESHVAQQVEEPQVDLDQQLQMFANEIAQVEQVEQELDPELDEKKRLQERDKMEKLEQANLMSLVQSLKARRAQISFEPTIPKTKKPNNQMSDSSEDEVYSWRSKNAVK